MGDQSEANGVLDLIFGRPAYNSGNFWTRIDFYRDHGGRSAPMDGEFIRAASNFTYTFLKKRLEDLKTLGLGLLGGLADDLDSLCEGVGGVGAVACEKGMEFYEKGFRKLRKIQKSARLNDSYFDDF